MAVEQPRTMPPHLSAEGRRSYLEIATRAQTECVHAYTVLSLGLQTYLIGASLLQPAQPDPPAPSHDAGGRLSSR